MTEVKLKFNPAGLVTRADFIQLARLALSLIEGGDDIESIHKLLHKHNLLDKNDEFIPDQES